MINEKRLLDTFIGYAMIDSETKNEKAMGEKLVEDLNALGLEVKTDKAGEGFGSNGFNVCAYLPGTIPGEPTIMCAHMDTVTPGNGSMTELSIQTDLRSFPVMTSPESRRSWRLSR